MKIKCSFCGGFFDDTETHCPNCGAINEGVVRTTSDQPQSIEQLKQWYKDRGLPPSETTRFFIGVDYRKPRAFGIYKDEQTGNFVVYKNKDSGQRAVRYEGTDEAYAVNELYMRLKQEIIEQKMNNVKKRQGQLHANQSGQVNSRKKKSTTGSVMSGIAKLILGCALCCVGFIAFLAILGGILIFFEPKVGYYSYQDQIYYHHDTSYNDKEWYAYVSGEWSEPLSIDKLPSIFEKKKTCKPYFLSKEWEADIPCTDFADSLWNQDLAKGIESKTGYYALDNKAYYHDEESFYIWYMYDDEWEQLAFSDVPTELRHSTLSNDYYISDAYSHIANETDFMDTIYYQDIIVGRNISTGYFKVEDQVFYHLENDCLEGWYSYVDDDWSYIEQEELPEELRHSSIVHDFCYTPTWDSSTQFTDFEDTALYEENKPASSSESSSDSDYDWDSGDSWDSGTTDWGSDW